MTTLLIVDDSPEMRRLIRNIAARTTDQVFECEDGEEVLNAFEAHRPDWVLMDVEMKRVNGLKATSDLIKQYPEAKVIVVTKYTDDQTRRAAEKAGARFFVGKDDMLSLRALVQERNTFESDRAKNAEA